MDGRDAETARHLFGMTIEMGDPDPDLLEECPRCHYDAVVTFHGQLISTLGMTALDPTRVCLRCYEKTGDPEAAIVRASRRCPECVQGKHPNCTGMALDPDTDDMVACLCAEAGHPT